MLGSRGIWYDGLKAVTTHPTVSGWSNFNEDIWQLSHTDTDRAELHELADCPWLANRLFPTKRLRTDS
jgi:hypothetical protein